MKKFLLILPIIALLLGACGPEPEPTPSMDEIQGTAVAAAFTMIAQTQAAIPTATPIPPTETPSPTAVPTNTVMALSSPTQFANVPPTATLATGEDNCDHILASDPPGPDFPLKIINETKAPANISIYLEKTAFGECGYRGYTVGPKNSILVRFPQGTMYGYVWINEPINTTNSGGPWRPNNTDKWSIVITEGVLKMVGP